MSPWRRCRRASSAPPERSCALALQHGIGNAPPANRDNSKFRDWVYVGPGILQKKFQQMKYREALLVCDVCYTWRSTYSRLPQPVLLRPAEFLQSFQLVAPSKYHVRIENLPKQDRQVQAQLMRTQGWDWRRTRVFNISLKSDSTMRLVGGSAENLAFFNGTSIFIYHVATGTLLRTIRVPDNESIYHVGMALSLGSQDTFFRQRLVPSEEVSVMDMILISGSNAIAVICMGDPWYFKKSLEEMGVHAKVTDVVFGQNGTAYLRDATGKVFHITINSTGMSASQLVINDRFPWKLLEGIDHTYVQQRLFIHPNGRLACACYIEKVDSSCCFRVYELRTGQGRWHMSRRLGSHAIFFSWGSPSPTFCIKNPGRWGLSAAIYDREMRRFEILQNYDKARTVPEQEWPCPTWIVPSFCLPWDEDEMLGD